MNTQPVVRTFCPYPRGMKPAADAGGLGRDVTSLGFSPATISRGPVRCPAGARGVSADFTGQVGPANRGIEGLEFHSLSSSPSTITSTCERGSAGRPISNSWLERQLQLGSASSLSRRSLHVGKHAGKVLTCVTNSMLWRAK